MDNQTTVIIADNSEDFSECLATLLREEGFQLVGIANDGETTIRMVADRKPHILNPSPCSRPSAPWSKSRQ